MARHGALAESHDKCDRLLDGLNPGALNPGALLGRGGICEVRLATTVDGERVAVKLPRADGVNRAAAQALIRREFRFLRKFSHPNVVNVLALARMRCDASPTSSDLGIAMEYVGGGDLVSLAGFPPRHWVPVAVGIAGALDYLHGVGVVHGDIKPRNVLLRDGDVPCLIDFALAARIGGPAPEGGGTAAYQRRRPAGKAEVDDDVHAFAVMVYELWTGTLPFGRNPLPEAHKRWRGVPERGSTPGVQGLGQVAAAVSGVLGTDQAARARRIGPLRHALESVVIDD